MIECLIKYYLISDAERIVCFEKSAKFAAVPFIGSGIGLENDFYNIDHVIFPENSLPILVVQECDIQESEIASRIEKVQEKGWLLVSDISN